MTHGTILGPSPVDFFESIGAFLSQMSELCMKKLFPIITMLWSATPLAADRPFTTVRYILPLEIKLGEYYLQSASQKHLEESGGSLRLGSEDLFLQLSTVQSRETNLPATGWLVPGTGWSGSAAVQSSLLNLTYLSRDSFFSFDIRQDARRIPGAPDDLQLGTALSYGHNISPFFAFMLGVKTTGSVDPLRASSLVIDYGKVFLTPGLQLRSRSVIVETFLEMPIYAYDQRTKYSEFIMPHDVRANIGIRYRR